MKNSSFLLLLFTVVTAITYSQENEVCKSNNIIVETLNEVNKCVVETKKNKVLKKEDVHIVAQNNRRVVNRYFIKRKKPKNNKTTLKKSLLPRVRKQHKTLKATNLDCAGVAKVNADDLSKSISTKDLVAYLSEKKLVPFEEVEEIPLFVSCNDKEDTLACFNTTMANYIADNFEYNDEVVSDNEVEKVTVSFVIDALGKVTSIKTKGCKQATELHNDLVKLIENLPVFVPAKNEGKKVSVQYEFEMNLSL